MHAALVLGWLLAAISQGAPEASLIRSLPEGRSYMSVVTAVPCPPTEFVEPPFQVEGVVVSDSEPEFLSRPTPTFYDLFAGCPRAGMFILRFTVTPEGTVTKPRIVRGSGCAAADQRVLEATRSWRFSPARKRGQAVSARITVSLNVDG